MLPTKLLIVFILHALDDLVNAEDETIIIKVRPELIINTFKSVISSEYLKKLANDFAVKAAKDFIAAIKNNGNQLSPGYRTPIREEKDKVDNDLSNERKILNLLKDPSPDGDNLDSIALSEEHHKIARKKRIPVIELRKINGVNYRRLLGLI